MELYLDSQAGDLERNNKTNGSEGEISIKCTQPSPPPGPAINSAPDLYRLIHCAVIHAEA